eukprot:2686107-Pyramimonas_sp.AAC.1
MTLDNLLHTADKVDIMLWIFPCDRHSTCGKPLGGGPPQPTTRPAEAEGATPYTDQEHAKNGDNTTEIAREIASGQKGIIK